MGDSHFFHSVFPTPQNTWRRIALGSDILRITLINETTNTEILLAAFPRAALAALL